MSYRYACCIGITACLISLPALAASVGRCGGTGGPQSTVLTCPSGQLVVGLFARGQWALDRFGIKCAPFDATGKSGTIGATMAAGGTGGTLSQDGTCAKDSAVYVISFYSGTVVDYLGGASCENKAQNLTPSKRRMNIDIGGGGGESCDVKCPRGEFINKVKLKYGGLGGVIDSIEGFCTPMP